MRRGHLSAVPTPPRRVYGHWQIVDDETGNVVHSIECHFPEGSSSFDKAEAGLWRKTDTDRFSIEWAPLP